MSFDKLIAAVNQRSSMLYLTFHHVSILFLPFPLSTEFSLRVNGKGLLVKLLLVAGNVWYIASCSGKPPGVDTNPIHSSPQIR